MALGVMFLTNYFISRFSDYGATWYALLVKPSFSPAQIVYDIGFLVSSGFAVICCTLSTVKKELRKTLVLWGTFCIFSALWALSLFVWESLYISLGIIFSIIVILIALFAFYQKHTQELWLAMLPPFAWNIYLFAFNYSLCMLN